MDENKNLASSMILELKEELAKGNNSVLKNFWLKMDKIGTPIIEPIRGDKSHKLVTFIVQADKETNNAIVVCSLANQDDVVSNNICERIENTDILYKSFVVLNGTRTIYTFSINNSLKYRRFYDNLMHNWDTLTPDPFNPNPRDLHRDINEKEKVLLSNTQCLKWQVRNH